MITRCEVKVEEENLYCPDCYGCIMTIKKSNMIFNTYSCRLCPYEFETKIIYPRLVYTKCDIEND